MSGITIESGEITAFAQALNAVPDVLGREFANTANALALEGIGLAQGYTPVDTGTLRNAIRMLERASVGTNVRASYGVSKADVVYALQREYGGTIRARNAPYLVFEVEPGHWIATEEVHQKGSQYMGRSKSDLEKKVGPAFAAAVQRALAMGIR